MQEKSKIIMKWKLIPSDFLSGYEDQIFSIFQAKVEDGEITITRETHDINDPSRERDQIQGKIYNFLLSISLVHRNIAFSLIPTSLEIESEGTRYLFVEACMYGRSGMDIELVCTNKDGQVIADSEEERMTRQQEFYELINNCGGDPTVVKILESFKNALDHDEKFLIYLYEIRDTLSSYFSNDQNTMQQLNLDSKQWSRFGRLSNDPSIKQSRHYSEISQNSRDITETERNIALSFALNMIESFLNYLKWNGNK